MPRKPDPQAESRKRQFAIYLKEVLEKSGAPASVTALAEKAGVTPSTISRVLAGNRGISESLARALADALRLDASDRHKFFDLAGHPGLWTTEASAPAAIEKPLPLSEFL